MLCAIGAVACASVAANAAPTSTEMVASASSLGCAAQPRQMFALSQGVQIFRVHDVIDVKQAILVYKKLLEQ